MFGCSSFLRGPPRLELHTRTRTHTPTHIHTQVHARAYSNLKSTGMISRIPFKSNIDLSRTHSRARTHSHTQQGAQFQPAQPEQAFVGQQTQGLPSSSMGGQVCRVCACACVCLRECACRPLPLFLCVCGVCARLSVPLGVYGRVDAHGCGVPLFLANADVEYWRKEVFILHVRASNVQSMPEQPLSPPPPPRTHTHTHAFMHALTYTPRTHTHAGPGRADWSRSAGAVHLRQHTGHHAPR